MHSVSNSDDRCYDAHIKAQERSLSRVRPCSWITFTIFEMEPITRDTHDIYPYISATGRLAGAAQGKTVIVTGGGKGIGKVSTKFAATSSR